MIDFIIIPKCKIAGPQLSFQLSLVKNILNVALFEGFQFDRNFRFYSRAFWISEFTIPRTPQDIDQEGRQNVT